ncbi:MAG: hypothetical protein QM703_04705 [Gemmatales bacterium]
MSKQMKYQVSGYEPASNGAVIFTVVPDGHVQNGRPNRVPQFVVAVRGTVDNLGFDWSGSPDNPGNATDEIQADITDRMKERFAWIHRVNELVTMIEKWARELGWSTRRIEKRLEDARVGTHRIPALLMQAETCQIILDPVGRSSPGTEGMVDLYLMPAYDDIASIYHYKGQWNLHYVFPNRKAVASVREAEAQPLSKDALEKVLAEMKKHAH